MRLLYLYIEDYHARGLHHEEYRLDSNDVFTILDGRLKYERREKLPDDFWTIRRDDGFGTVDSVSALIGENGAGKTSFANVLGGCFNLGAREPKYLCIVKEGSQFKEYDNLETAICFEDVEAILGDQFMKHREVELWSPQKPPFQIVYYSPFCSCQCVWQRERENYHDLSVSAFFSKHLSASETPLILYDKYCRDVAFSFARVFSLRYKDNCAHIPFPIPRFVQIIRNPAVSIDCRAQIRNMLRDKSSKCNDKFLLMMRRAYELAEVPSFEIRLLIDYASEIFQNARSNKKLDILINSDEWKRLMMLCIKVLEGVKGKNHLKVNHKGHRVLDFWLSRSKLQKQKTLGLVIRGLNRNINRNKGGEFVNWAILREVYSHFYAILDSGAAKVTEDLIKFSLTSSSEYRMYVELKDTYEKLGIGSNALMFSLPGMSSGEMAFLCMWGRLYRWLDSQGLAVDADSHHAETEGGSELAHVLLFLDEAETTLHPEWQRQLVNAVIWFFETFSFGVSVHVILATHSPMLLSDVPESNVIFMPSKEDSCAGLHAMKECEGLRGTFGANIFDLYRDSFFLRQGTVGAFATEKIKLLLRSVSAIGAKKAGLEVVQNAADQKLMSEDQVKAMIPLVGDPALKKYFKVIEESGLL